MYPESAASDMGLFLRGAARQSRVKVSTPRGIVIGTTLIGHGRRLVCSWRAKAEARTMDPREPTLDELLNEPIIQAIMVRDGVRAEEIRRLMRQVRTRMLRARYADRSALAREIDHVPLPPASSSHRSAGAWNN